MKETLHIFSGTPSNARWEESVEGLSNARERMEQLAATKPGQYFLVSFSAISVLAQTETFSHPRRASESNDQISTAEQLCAEFCSEMTPYPH
jgi:hypothetical protein